MKLMMSAHMRELDRRAIEEKLIPSTLLMRNASEQVAKEAMSVIGRQGRAAVFCGSGNNGGDGVAAARYLLIHGIEVRAFLTGNREKMTSDTAEMERRLNEVGGKLEQFTESKDIEDYVNSCDVIIDAMFGTGLHSALRGDSLNAARIINTSRAYVVSADMPSGVSADTGEVYGEAVRADETVTFTFAKTGQFLEPGCTYCGRIIVKDIGIPAELCVEAESNIFAVCGEDIRLPVRRPDSHKGDYGRDLIIAGAPGFSGAPVMAANACSKMGAGLVYLGVPDSIYSITAGRCTEVMPFSLPCGDAGRISGAAGTVIGEKARHCDVMLIGPGLGRSSELNELVSRILEQITIPVILDADGINAVSGDLDALDRTACPVILTPHAGEFARLGGDSSRDRLSEATDFAKKHGCIMVLKGHTTITAFPDGSAYINTTGCPAMSKGGSGDLLAGMIAALIGQKLPLREAVISAVYIHGLAGNICSDEMGEYSVTPDDLLKAIPKAVKRIIC